MAGRDNSPFDRGSIEVSLSYRIPNARFKPRLYLQYFSGYGDTEGCSSTTCASRR